MLTEVNAQPGENVTLDAPLEHIDVYVPGGSILALQQPKYTTEETRQTPYSLLVALNDGDKAGGSLYLDDGESLVPNATRLVQVSGSHSHLSRKLAYSSSSRTMTTACPLRPKARTMLHLHFPMSLLLVSTNRLTTCR